MANETSTDTRITKLEVELHGMSKQISEIAGDMKKVLDLTSKLTLLDERQSRHSTDIDRAFNEIRAVRTETEEKLQELDRHCDSAKKETQSLRRECEGWINWGKGAWAAASILWLACAGILYNDYKDMRKEVTALTYENKIQTETAKREVK